MNKEPVTDSLERFVVAQNSCYPNVLSELRAEKKRTHWMWFIFPQIRGLGKSEYASYFGLADLNEAKAFFHHPILGARYQDCLSLLDQSKSHAEQILGPIDAKKLQSSLTLFLQVDPKSLLLLSLIKKFYDGKTDQATLAILKK